VPRERSVKAPRPAMIRFRARIITIGLNPV
jgi:hypothetical protein